MNARSEGYNSDASETFPIEILSDEEMGSIDQGTFDPFAPMSPEQRLRNRKRFAAMMAKRKADEEKVSAYMLDMYNPEDVDKRLKFAERQKEMGLLKSVLDQMRMDRPCRPLTPQPGDYGEILDALKSRYPHFNDVIEMLRARMRLNGLKKHPTLEFGANILLLGAPGCGKSSFLLELGESLGTKFISISCASMSMAGELSGLSTGWSTAQPGMVFETLVQQGCANPIMLLDEIDKSQAEGSHLFMSALYSLLEKNDARRFRDEFVGVPIDASRINWFASANDIDLLSAPIRDRFEVICVNEPTKEELLHMLPQIYKKLVAQHGLQDVFADELAMEVVDVMLLGHMSIRRLKAALETAMANASARAGESDTKLLLRPEDVPVDNQVRSRDSKIGFIQ